MAAELKERFLGKVRSAEYKLFGTQVAPRILERVDCTYSNESAENLLVQGAHLKKGSLVTHFNHITYWDPFIVSAVATREFWPDISGIVMPMGLVHYDLVLQDGGVKAKLIENAGLLGVEITPVPQPHRAEQEAKLTMYEPGKLVKNYVLASNRVLSREGGIKFISQEGHRSETGELIQAQVGLKREFNRGPNPDFVAFSSWAVVPRGDYDRDWGLREAELVIGRPNTKKELDRLAEKRGIEHLPFHDQLMVDLALLLPEERRGVYAKYIVE